MRNKRKRFKRILKPKGEPISSIPKSFLKPTILPLSVVRKEYRCQIRYDERHRLNAGGWFTSDPHPIFTSRNSHKKTNKHGRN